MTRGVKEYDFCTIKDCDRKHFGRSFCELHYRKWREENALSICSIYNCNLTIKNKGYCSKHYTRLWRYGDPLFIPEKQPKKSRRCKGKLNFIYDLREKQEDTPVDFNKILQEEFWNLLA